MKEKLDEVDKMATVLAMVVATYKKTIRLWQCLAFFLLALCILLGACLISMTPSKLDNSRCTVGVASAVGATSIVHRVVAKGKPAGKRAGYV